MKQYLFLNRKFDLFSLLNFHFFLDLNFAGVEKVFENRDLWEGVGVAC